MDLAALNIKIGADLSELERAMPRFNSMLDAMSKAVQKTNAVLDGNSKELASIASASSAANGGMKAFSESINNLGAALSTSSKGFDNLEASLSSMVSEFAAKWDPIVTEAAKLAMPLEQAAVKVKELQTQIGAFGGGVLQFKSQGAQELLQQSKLILDSVNGIPLNTVVNFSLSSNTQQALAELSSLSVEIKDLGDGGSVSIAKINTALAQLRTASANATNVQNIQQYDKAIGLLKNDLVSIIDTTKKAGVSLSTIGSATNAGSLAIGNFGRVLQDLPYGFIGISNNLNPLLESFQRLSSEAKNTGVSISTLLVKSLSGGGGLGLAVSAVTAAISFATIGLSMWTRGMGNSKSATDEAIKSNEDYQKSLKNISDSALEQAQKSIAQITILTKTAQDNTTALNQRLEAAGKLQENSSYFAALSKEQILYGNITEAINQTTQALFNKAYAEAAQGKFTEAGKRAYDLLLKQREALRGLNTAQANYDKARNNPQTGQAIVGYSKILEKAKADYNSVSGALYQAQLDQAVFLNDAQKYNKLTDNVDKAAVIMAKLGNQIDLLNKKSLATGSDLNTEKINAYKKAVDDLFELPQTAETKKDIDEVIDKIKVLGGTFDQADKKAAHSADRISSALLELKNSLKIIDLSEGGNPVKKYDAIYSTVKKLLDLKVPENGTIIQKLIGDANQLYVDNLSTFTKKFGEKITEGIKLPKAPIDIKINPILDKDQLEVFIKRAKIEAAASDLSIELPVNFKSLNGNDLDLLTGPLKEIDAINEKMKVDFGEGLPESLKKFYQALKKLEGGKQQLYDIKGFAQSIKEEYGGNIPEAYQKYIDAAEKANEVGDFKGAAKAIEQAQKLKNAMDELQKSLQQVAADTLTDFFAAIGDSMAGATNPFQAFANTMAQGFKSMGEALIRYGVEVGIIQKVFNNPMNPVSPILAIAAGIALEALGASVQKNLGFTKMATGGIIPPGFEGDRFPAFLNSGEAVIPLDKLNQYIQPVAPSDMRVYGEMKINGTDLYVLFRRAERKFNRTY